MIEKKLPATGINHLSVILPSVFFSFLSSSTVLDPCHPSIPSIKHSTVTHTLTRARKTRTCEQRTSESICTNSQQSTRQVLRCTAVDDLPVDGDSTDDTKWQLHGGQSLMIFIHV